MAVVIDRVWPHDPFHDDQLPDGLDDPTNPAVMDYHKHKDDKLEREDTEDQEPEDTEPDGTEELLQLAQQPLCRLSSLMVHFLNGPLRQFLNGPLLARLRRSMGEAWAKRG